jgi:hypothetical protein
MARKNTAVGYELHITRAESWFENENAPIPLDEWLALANADPELRAMPENGEAFFEYGDDGWFDWFEGNVDTKSPERGTIAKMLELAERLGASVRGDDGELYVSPDQFFAS